MAIARRKERGKRLTCGVNENTSRSTKHPHDSEFIEAKRRRDERSSRSKKHPHDSELSKRTAGETSTLAGVVCFTQTPQE